MNYREMKFHEVCNLVINDLPAEIKTTLLVATSESWFEMTNNGKTFVARKANGRFDGEDWAFQTSFGSDEGQSTGFSKPECGDVLPAAITYYAKELLK